MIQIFDKTDSVRTTSAAVAESY